MTQSERPDAGGDRALKAETKTEFETPPSNPQSPKEQTHARRSAAERRQIALAVLPALAEMFPAAFSSPPRPLKLRIDVDLGATGLLTPDEAQAVLAYRCGGISYLRSLLAGAPRVDLNGNPVGVVTEAEAAHATSRVAWVKRLIAERKAPNAPPAPVNKPAVNRGVGGEPRVSPKPLAPNLAEPPKPMSLRPTTITLSGSWKKRGDAP